MQAARKFVLTFVGLFLLLKLNATHNRAGEITYTRIAPTTTVIMGETIEVYKYRITIITYTDDGPLIADRCMDTLFFGDDTRGVAYRVNGSTNCQCSNSSSVHCGEIIISDPVSNYKVKKNVYVIEHQYPGPGVYRLRCLDPNRNKDVINIPNSVNLPFYIESLLIINSFSGANTSPVLNNAPIDRACIGQCFEHNPAAYDADGDSLSFEISTSRGADGLTVTGYTYPNEVNGNGGTYSINPVTGTLIWCSPQEIGEYNIAFIVREWRKNTNGVYMQTGYVLRDMQVIVGECPAKHPPQLKVPQDTCIEAGVFLTKKIIATDPDNGNFVTIYGSGGSFSANYPPSNLSNVSGVTYTTQNGALIANYTWSITCDHIRQQPYITTFKAEDNDGGTKQVSFATYAIRVVPPSIKSVTATPAGSAIQLNWQTPFCNSTGNPITGYKIYRKNDCTPYIPQPCASNIPASSGFVLIGQVNPKTTSFTDNNAGDGLVVGQSYSYLIIVEYSDGTQSISGTQVCSQLKREVPVIINVDVLSTSVNAGAIKIAWLRPLLNKNDFDTTVFKGPYTFVLKHLDASGQTAIFTTTANSVLKLDTFYTHQNINTTVKSEEYIIDFYSGTTSIGSSQKAGSVFLTTQGADRKINLSWAAKTPWNNYKYSILRKDPSSTTFTTIATTTAQSYSDKNHIVNGYAYCYQIISEGAYSDIRIPKPLINHSQESCARAIDLTPPCSPTLIIDADCPKSIVTITWDDIKTICSESDDVTRYYLFYKPTIYDEYLMLDSILVTEKRLFISDTKELISGCYAIMALDSARNKSALSPDFCIDNCPVFELPNVFTPNGDDINDFFKAIKVYQIKEIDLTVYDRWGNQVYRTRDPYFKWDGKSSATKQEVSEGTFFYVCDVYEPRVRGIMKRTLKGTVEMVR